MSSRSARDRLCKWGISEEVIKRFEDTHITEDLLPFLDDGILKNLIPSPLEIVRFKVHRSKELVASKPNVIATADDVGVVTIVQDYEGIIPESTAETVIYPCDGVGTEEDNEIGKKEWKQPASSGEDTSLVKPSGSQAPAIEGCWNDTAEIDLEQVVKKTTGGTAIWNLYQIHKELRDSDRDAIAASIIDHELQLDLNRRISAGRFVYLAKQVVKTFPTETLSVWALIETGGRFVTGKGKLYNRWSNTRRKYMKLQLIPCSRKGCTTSKATAPVPNHGELNTSEGIEPENLMDDTILWLKNNATPWVTVEKNWSETSAARRRILINENIAIFDYVKEYPALKDPRGYLLLEIDFDILYPEKAKSFFTSWPSLRNLLIKRVPQVCGISVDSIQDPTAQTNFLLTNLSLIFRVIVARKKNKNIKEWRPSKSEVQEAFVLHVKVIGDLDVKLQERRARLARFGCQLQPLVAVVGPSFEEINQSFVILGIDSRFEVETPLRAIDVVFKCMYALDAQFPAEATHVWQFIQRGVYGIPRNKTDRTFTDVEKLLNELSNFQK